MKRALPRSRSRPQPRGDIKRSRMPQPRTAEDVSNEETAEKLALQIWAAMVAKNSMSALMDELIQSHLLDDDDEEADEGWLDDHGNREKKLLDEVIADGLDRYPDLRAISGLPSHSDPDIAQDAEQLKGILGKCAIGATRFKDKFTREQLERMVKRDLKARFEKDPKYSTHVREDVPGAHVKQYGSRGRTSSKGTFVRAHDYASGGGGLAALLTGGWLRVAKDRIDPYAWSHAFGRERKSERQSWRHCFYITERNGRRSFFELPREKLVSNGRPAISLLMKAGIHVVNRDVAERALVRFLRWKPKHEIVRMPRVGWAEIDGELSFVRHDEVITPPGMPRSQTMTYVLDAAATRHGLHVVGTTAEWATEVAEPLRHNSNVVLAFATFFAAPLLRWASEPGGGIHLHGPSTIGKTWVSDAAQSIYGWPHETADNAFGVTWAGSEAGFDALALARADTGLALDEITLSNRRTAEQIVYKLASGSKGPRASSTGQLRETVHASVLVLSTGEKSLAEFVDNLQEGARKRLVDVPAEVVQQPGSAFETIPRERLHLEAKRSFDAVKRQHGAVGRDWQRYLVYLGLDAIKKQLNQHREAFLALPEVVAVADKAHPQVVAALYRFALYAAATRMVIEAGLLPWTTEETDAGIVACMRRWVQQRGNIDTAEQFTRAVAEFKIALAAALPDRFIHIRKVGGKWAPVTEADEIRQRTWDAFDGYAKPDRVLLWPEAWHRLCNGVDPAVVARRLQQEGTLIDSKPEQVPGRVARFYVLSRKALTP